MGNLLNMLKKNCCHHKNFSSVGEQVDRFIVTLIKETTCHPKEISNDILNTAKMLFEECPVEFLQLFCINSKIWGIESGIRNEDFQDISLEDIGRRTLEIRKLNLMRNQVKKDINTALGNVDDSYCTNGSPKGDGVSN